MARTGIAIGLAVAVWAALLVLRLAAFGGSAPSGVVRRLIPTTCVFSSAGGPPLPPTTCGTMRVPERRDASGGRTIDVAYAVIHATAAHPAPDPLVFLAGGPGDAAVPEAASLYRDALAAVTRGARDVVLIDPRGTGLSRPSLDCNPELSAPGAAAAVQQALLDCRNRWVQSGVDLSAYGSAAMAADVTDLMRSLGYRAYNLIGVSYGTRVALTLLRDEPGRVRSVILDSTVPPQVDAIAEAPASLNRALHALSDACGAQLACAAASPDLYSTVVALVDRLNGDPRAFTLDAPSGPVSLRMTGAEILLLIDRALYSDLHPARVTALPAAIRAAAANNFGPLVAVGRGVAATGAVAAADYYSVTCREQPPAAVGTDPTASLPAALVRALRGRSSVDTTSLCRAWGAVPTAAADRAPVFSRVPALILAGSLDPITPPRLGREAAATLPESTYLLFPGVGHAVLGDTCGDRAMAAFLDDPGGPLDTPCAAHPRPPLFTP